MSIHLLSLTYFTNDRVCYMQGIVALLPWTDQGAVATKFRKWFNNVANKRWSDNKNRSLRRTYDSLGAAVPEHSPDQCDPEIWGQLIQQYQATQEADETGTVK